MAGQACRSLGLPRPAASTRDCWERRILGPGNQHGSGTLYPGSPAGRLL